ncbi:Bug family tripartite tricarboxylate transporter substrate binding protein [Ottowia thiooxydans]|uniref:Bug family tripartite tricarboxylate transporter substrate binding protein n=1 Tax=Ottowia thiooxydans TaxID=219182 RepID=UPI000402B77C|nr:tripartite tricarboxylate transporter substrate binding protein [Ottowia thiooxydans]
MKRRQIVHVLAGAGLLSSVTHLFAQRNSAATQIIVPFGPGGSADIVARLVAHYMTEKSGLSAVIDNRPGASGIIGMEAGKLAPADGRTLVVVSSGTQGANPSLFRKLPYDPEKDFTVVGILGVGGSYLLVRADAPWKTLADFVAQAKAKPGRINFGQFSAASAVPAALLSERAGIEMTGVPYKQIGTAVTDLLGGQTQMMFIDTVASEAYVASGQLRALAVTHTKRLPRDPNIPTIAETYPGFEMVSFLGVAVPAATPLAVKESLNKMINEATTDEAVKAKLESLSFLPRPMSLQECVELNRSERVKWRGYVVTAKLAVQ